MRRLHSHKFVLAGASLTTDFFFSRDRDRNSLLVLLPAQLPRSHFAMYLKMCIDSCMQTELRVEGQNATGALNAKLRAHSCESEVYIRETLEKALGDVHCRLEGKRLCHEGQRKAKEYARRRSLREENYNGSPHRIPISNKIGGTISTCAVTDTVCRRSSPGRPVSFGCSRCIID